MIIKGSKTPPENIFRESVATLPGAFFRNILGHAPASQRGSLAQSFSRLFRSETMEEARTVRNEILRTFEKKAPKAMEFLDDGFDEAMNILTFPKKYRVRLRSTNSQERLNEELRRRSG